MSSTHCLSLIGKVSIVENCDEYSILQALAGEVGMDNELDEVARALFNGQLPACWRKLAPATLKNLGGWMDHFTRRHEQYLSWVIEIDVLLFENFCVSASPSKDLMSPR